MSEHQDACAVSRILDDGGTGSIAGPLAAQQRVHDALRGTAPMARPSTDIASRVMMRIGAPAATPAPRAPRAAWWPAAIAAVLTIAAATSWYISRPPATKPPDQPLAGGAGLPSGFAAVLEPLAKSDAAVHASMEAPFLQQAQFIRDDTREGMEMVLSRLPLGDSLLK